MKKKNFKVIFYGFALFCIAFQAIALTYTWFTTTRRSHMEFNEVQIEEGLQYNLYYFTQNYDIDSKSFSGYPSPDTVIHEENKAGVTSFTQDFKAANALEGENPFLMVDLNPGISHTFCFALTSKM